MALVDEACPKEQHQFTLRNGRGVELKDGTSYSIAVAAVLSDDRGIAAPVQATPQPNWMNWNQINNLVLALLFGGIVFYAISHGQKAGDLSPAYSRPRRRG